MSDARRLWQRFEPYHAVGYFAPEAGEVSRRAGWSGFWMGYFATRAAPLGPVPPSLVTALFFGFAPRVVERALPEAWRRCGPSRRRPCGPRCGAGTINSSSLQDHGTVIDVN